MGADGRVVRPAAVRESDRPRYAVPGRRERGRLECGGNEMSVQSQTAVVSSSQLTLRRVVAVVLGAALVAAAAQVTGVIPGTPVPFTLQPLAVLIVGGLLRPSLGAASLILYLFLCAAGLPGFTPLGLPRAARLLGPPGGDLLASP